MQLIRFFPGRPLVVVAAVVVFGLLSGGCGSKGEGPERYPIFGAVTYQGKPVPVGTILFQPDAAKGGDGPSAEFPIKDGKFRSDQGEGTLGGPHLVYINGTTGEAVILPDGMKIPEGKPLFSSYRTEVDLPRERYEKNFDVPEIPRKHR